MYRYLITFCLVVGGAFPVFSAAQEALDTTPALALDPAQIVEGLPWTFAITTTVTTGQDASTTGDADEPPDTLSEPSATSLFHLFTSSEPYRETEQAKLFLRADLQVTQFEDPETAELAFQRIRDAAHPDMGLSYEWDHVILDTDALFHLHAACTFSEASYRQMVERLEAIARRTDNGGEQIIDCRCGASCKFSP